MALASDLYWFLRNPGKTEKKTEKFITVLREFVIFDLIITFSWALLIAICSLFFDEFVSVFKSKKTINDTTINIFLAIVFIAPVLEELAYRFSLRISKLTISVSLSVQLILYLHLLRVIHVTLTFRIILMMIIAIVLYFILNEKLFVYLNKKINFYIYFNLFSFTFLHALNFSYSETYHFLFIPILISLQFFFGLYLSYVRLKHRFLYVVSFHILHNSLIFCLGLLMKM